MIAKKLKMVLLVKLVTLVIFSQKIMSVLILNFVKNPKKDSLLVKNAKKTSIYQKMVYFVLLLQIVFMEIEKQEYAQNVKLDSI
jgi:hypothetical protein